MRRTVLAALGVVAVAAAAGPAGALPNEEVPRDKAELIDFGCRVSGIQADRAIRVTAAMKPIHGTRRLKLVFHLRRRGFKERTFSDVKGEGLGTAISPNGPNQFLEHGDVWKHEKRVTGLTAPADYKFSVGFYWVGADGREIGSTTRTTRECTQNIGQARDARG